MRYIDLDLLVGRPDTQPLINAAEVARNKILCAPDAKTRKKLIKDNRPRWVAFRQAFEELFGDKCWYTESINPGTDDDVDHFRPKGDLAECPSHEGYWWEALHWRNFRLSCHRGNRLRKNPDTGQTHGKGDHFPLVDEGARWHGPGEQCRESPALLDPTDPADPPLLTFDPDGRVALSPVYESDQVAALRVEQSRLYLNLDWEKFVRDRSNLYATIYTKVMDGDRADAAFMRHELGARDMLKSVARDLIRLTKDRAPYSRAALAYILLFRDREWVKRLILPHIPSGSAP